MKHVRQQPRSCGQAVLAMAVGVDLRLATYAVGRRGATSVRLFDLALRRFGRRLGKARRVRGLLPPARVRGVLLMPHEEPNPQGMKHVAWLAGDGLVRDPFLARPVPLERYPRHMRRMGLLAGWWIPVRREDERKGRSE